MRPLLAAALLAGFAVAAPVPKAAKKKDDATQIVGTWKPAADAGCWYQFNADGTMQTWHGLGKGSPLDWTWTLDPTATPKRMKLTRAVGSGVYDCIYELDGDGLKIAFVLGAKDPQKVEAAPGLQLYEQTRDSSSR
jgi:uncharacterized protein (TIGR03067 family)